jgi:cysteine-rich repeat protein
VENPYIQLQNNRCSGLCGDGVLNITEQCDDGNRQPRDGCSANCTVETNYNCTNMTSFLGYNYTAFCSYLVSIQLTVLTVEKL